MWHVYALKSTITGRRYVGMTSLTPEERLQWHNNGRVKSTKPFRPYELIFSEPYETAAAARQREKYLKSGAGRQKLDALDAL